MGRFPFFTLAVGLLVAAVASVPGFTDRAGFCSEKQSGAKAEGAPSPELVARVTEQVRSIDVAAALAPVVDCAAGAVNTVTARLERPSHAAVRDGEGASGMSRKTLVGQVAALFQEPGQPMEHRSLAILISDTE